jgi:hypothetical protein
MITTDKIIEIFCIANDFYLEIQNRTALTTYELKTRIRGSVIAA